MVRPTVARPAEQSAGCPAATGLFRARSPARSASLPLALSLVGLFVDSALGAGDTLRTRGREPPPTPLLQARRRMFPLAAPMLRPLACCNCFLGHQLQKAPVSRPSGRRDLSGASLLACQNLAELHSSQTLTQTQARLLNFLLSRRQLSAPLTWLAFAHLCSLFLDLYARACALNA